MTARIRKFLYELGEAFWLLPALMVLGGVIGAVVAMQLDRAGVPMRWLGGRALAL